MKEVICLCDCGDFSHLVIFQKDEDNLIWVFHNLNNKLKFFERLKRGIKYILGIKIEHGDYGALILREEDEIKLKELLNENK